MTEPRQTDAIRIAALGIATCLGRGRAAHLSAMRQGRSGLAPCDFPGLTFPCHAGEVAGLDAEPFPEALADWDNRAARIALAALRADGLEARVADAVARHGAERVALVVGTSTSGVETLERVYRARPRGERLAEDYSMRHHNDHQAVTAFLQRHCAIAGPAHTVSTACSSSAKALVDAVQLVEAGVAEAVLCGGVDSLCLTSLGGFEALELVSRAPCRPCDAARDGLSIGEGAAFLLVERGAAGPRLAGHGESSDGTNMSTPPPDGAGAAAAMRAALAMAGLAPGEIDYVNLHGTATPANDTAECAAVVAVLGAEVPVASFKGMVGHTLGAAGAVEIAMTLIAMEAGLQPGTVGLERVDPEIAAHVLAAGRAGPMRRTMTNAFGFGGNNCALVLEA